MSTTKPILPRLKERVMYISKTNSSSKIQASYPIASSYKGILRLSPNNHSTVNQKNQVQLSLSDEKALGTTYTDAIIFDDEALKSIKTDADISRRLIIGSDSDGYLVNFRIGLEDIQFDNLGIIGTLQSNDGVYIYSKLSSTQPQLVLDNTIMPSTANGQNPIFVEDKVEDIKDMKKVVVKGKGDNSTLAYSITKDKKRIFKHKLTSLFVKQLIMEALLGLQTIPTGSIHWLPVTYAQYQHLMNNTGDDPATYANKTDFTDDNGEKTQYDPILRDFLLCDGREYDNYRYPELAKILWGQKVVHWVDQKIKDYNDNYIGFYPQQYTNDYTTKKKFRVPDLRHMFIASSQIPYTSKLINDTEDDYKGEEKNITGTYTPDNLPRGSKAGSEQDNHFHFIAYGTNGMFYESKSQEWADISLQGHPNVEVAVKAEYNNEFLTTSNSDSDSKSLKKTRLRMNTNNTKNDVTGIMYLQNHPIYRNTKFSNGTTQQNGSNGFGYGKFSPQRSCEWKNLRTNYSIPAVMYLSMPGLGEDAHRKDLLPLFDRLSMGFNSSSQFLSVDNPESNNVYGAEKNYLKGQKYAEFSPEIYGHESTAKYYTMLPLIKI